MSRVKEIRHDIIPFTDPGSEVEVDGELMSWRKDGTDQMARLVQTYRGNLPDVRVNEGPAVPYPDFLASSHLADLRGLAEFILRTIPRPKHYVETRASPTESGSSDSSSHRRASAVELIAKLAGDLSYGSTRMILVQGPAGSGKTMALKRMTLVRAQEYVDGTAESLFLYIDAQGRALSRLDDAMARDLQDLRSRFSYNAVPTLVRRGLLIPVIDGFDELLGSGGYDEAFSSLAAFISRLEGSGAVVASARSTFFDYNAFRNNAERFAQNGTLNYEVESVDIEPWDDAEAEELVRSTVPVETVDRFRGFRDELTESERALLRKPFYVSQVANLLAEGDRIESQTALLDTLVNAFLERERKKFRDKEGNPLLDVRGHRRLLVMLADEMWWLETRRLDLETVRVAAELVLDELGVSADSARQVIDRMPSYGLLRRSGSGVGNLRFEHEMFHGYFLAEAFKQCIHGDRAELRRFLARSVLDEAVVDQVVNLYNADVDKCTDAAIRVCDVLQRGLGDVVARQNGGRFVARVVKACGRLRKGAALKHLYFDQEDFGQAVLVEPRFQNCHFDRADFRRLRMVRPVFRECTIQMPMVSLEGTRLDDAASTLATMVTGVAIMPNGRVNPPAEKAYAPDQIRAILVRLGMQGEEGEDTQSYAAEQRERIQLLERFLLKMERRFYVAAEDFPQLGLRGPVWDDVYRLLQEHGITREEQRQVSGPRRPLLRLGYPPDIIRRGENTEDGRRPEIQRFWSELLNVK